MKGYDAYIGYGGVAIGIVYSLISAILIYGARARNQTAIFVWICFAILECIGLFITTICFAIGSEFDENDENDENDYTIFIIFILLAIGIIIFEISTIIVALFARKEI
mgnify:FL=1